MKEIEVQDIINMNYRVLTLLGMMTSILMDCKSRTPRAEHIKFDWILCAINEVIYKGNAIPPMPFN